MIKKYSLELTKLIIQVTIAHRLETVVTYDRIVVLENGKVIEEGSPETLLKSESEFLRLVRSTNKDLESKLISLLESSTDNV